MPVMMVPFRACAMGQADTYISYHCVGPQILLYKQSDMKLVKKKTTQTKNKHNIKQNRYTDVNTAVSKYKYCA
jgi:hypothetical protein